MKSFFKTAALLAPFFIGSAAAQETEGFVAKVGALDKITARITELDLPAHEPVTFGTLKLVAEACYKRPPTETPETYIYLKINDVLANGTEVQVFEGWMLESSPALNALEHAVYDVWAMDCRTTSGDSDEG